MEVNYLVHHGIKGQKWGVRRFQYEDDSLTPEGKIRYGVGDGKKKQSLKEQAQRDDPVGMRAQSKLNTRKAIAAIGGVAGLATASVAGLDFLKRQSLIGQTFKKSVPHTYTWFDTKGTEYRERVMRDQFGKIDKLNIGEFHNFGMTKNAAIGIAAVATVGAAAVAAYNHAKYKSKEREYYSQVGKEVLSKSQTS